MKTLTNFGVEEWTEEDADKHNATYAEQTIAVATQIYINALASRIANNTFGITSEKDLIDYCFEAAETLIEASGDYYQKTIAEGRKERIR